MKNREKSNFGWILYNLMLNLQYTGGEKKRFCTINQRKVYCIENCSVLPVSQRNKKSLIAAWSLQTPPAAQ